MTAALSLQPLSHRDSASHLSQAALHLVHSLGLRPPRPDLPGYWTTADNFLKVSADVLKRGFRRPSDALRLLVTFDPRGIQAEQQARVAAEFPGFDALPEAERRRSWSRILTIGKEVREARVIEIVRHLLAHDIDIATETIVVHRVMHSFFVTLDARALRRLLDLVEAGYGELRYIKIDKTADG